MRRLVVMASLLVLAATACKIETNMGAIINADGSGTLVVELGMDEEAQGFLLSDGTDPFEGNDAAECPGARRNEEQRGDLKFFIIECDVTDLAELESAMTDTENTMMQNFDITVTPTLVSVTAQASAEETFGGAEDGQFTPEMLEQSVSANLKITMPGRILDHNADDQDGNTLIWHIPVAGGQLDVRASSDPTGNPAGGGGGGFPLWLIVVIAVVVLGGAYYLYTQNKKKGGTAPADTPPPAPTA